MMKITWAKILLCGFLLLLLPFSTVEAQPAAADSSCMVLIDPAHGGSDTGVKVSKKGVEKDITLAVALALKKQLEESDRKITVCLTRTEDAAVSIDERIRMAEQLKPRALISLHVNGGFGAGASGYEISFPGQQNITKESAEQHMNRSIRLGQRLQKSLEEVFPRKGRGIREAPVPLLSVLHAPSVCVELAFLTNEADRDKIISAKTQKDVVQALAKGIREYLK
ncbi:MAG: N-acetylmuramoyl-L-alanine amidase [Syntrophobacterales bacterium]|nr:N-acetylmuramoyl-L-alanine amidase [Syntrophobacterales bacterium]